VYASREDHIVPWHSAYRTTALLGGEVTFTLGASGHIAGVINSPEKQRRNFWANPDALADADEWLARAESRPGSWWPHWEAWLAQHAGTKKPAPNAPGNQSYLPLRPAPGAYVLESAGPR
jgi:polyhydroxyalkanoate synthase